MFKLIILMMKYLNPTKNQINHKKKIYLIIIINKCGSGQIKCGPYIIGNIIHLFHDAKKELVTNATLFLFHLDDASWDGAAILFLDSTETKIDVFWSHMNMRKRWDKINSCKPLSLCHPNFFWVYIMITFNLVVDMDHQLTTICKLYHEKHTQFTTRLSLFSNLTSWTFVSLKLERLLFIYLFI